MNKVFKAFAVSFAVFMAVGLSSCGAGWEQVKKNHEANIGGGLVRYVKVYDFVTKETVYEFTGRCYLDGESKPGNFTLMIYDDDGNPKKMDFIGHTLSMIMLEK